MSKSFRLSIADQMTIQRLGVIGNKFTQVVAHTEKYIAVLHCYKDCVFLQLLLSWKGRV